MKRSIAFFKNEQMEQEQMQNLYGGSFRVRGSSGSFLVPDGPD